MTRWNQDRGDERNTAVAEGDRIEGPQRRPTVDWTTELRGPVRCAPVLDRDTIYVGTADGDLTALDLQGRRRWVFQTTEATTVTPAVCGHRVLCSLTDTLLAIDSPTGDLEWQREIQGLYTTPPTVDGDLVLIGDDSGLAALRADTGAEIWQADLDGVPTGAPAVDDTRVYVTTRDETVHALELGSGESVWTAPTDGTPVAGPTRADDRVYVADDDGTVLALGVDAGQTFFTYQIRDSFTGGPTVLEGGDTLFVPADDGRVHVTDTTFGNRKLRGLLFSKPGLDLDGLPTTDVIVAGDIALVADDTGGLFAIDATDPDFSWYIPHESPAAATPAVAAQIETGVGTDGTVTERGHLFLGDESGTLTCYTWAQ